MTSWFILIALSYAVFVFTAERLNPLKTSREVGRRHRLKSGRRAGLVTLFTGVIVLTASKFMPLILQPKSTDIKSTDIQVSNQLGSAAEDVENTLSDTTKTSELEDEQTVPEPIASIDNTESIDNSAIEPDSTPTSESDIPDNILGAATPAQTPVAVSKPTQWISDQEPQDYTIQIEASEDQAYVERFLSQRELPAPHAVISFDNNGTTWYALIQGAYNSRQSAELAKTQLTRIRASNDTPLVLQFAQLQNTLLAVYESSTQNSDGVD